MPSVVRFSPNGAGAEVTVQLRLPRRGLLDRVGVDRLVGAAVHRAVGLVVAREVDAAHRDAALDRRLPDRRAHGPPPGADLARRPTLTLTTLATAGISVDDGRDRLVDLDDVGGEHLPGLRARGRARCAGCEAG